MSCLALIRRALLVAAVAAAATPAVAQQAPALHVAAVDAVDAVPATTAAAAAPKALLFTARRAGNLALAQQRGGTDLSSDTSLRGVVTDNQASGNATGSNLITGGALAGASGVPVVVQNTGNNVLIQSATIVNVQLK